MADDEVDSIVDSQGDNNSMAELRKRVQEALRTKLDQDVAVSYRQEQASLSPLPLLLLLLRSRRNKRSLPFYIRTAFITTIIPNMFCQTVFNAIRDGYLDEVKLLLSKGKSQFIP